MPLKPQQTAKYVGVKWTPNPEMASTFVEPLVDKKRYEYMRRSGRVVLNSVGIRNYDGMNIAKAAEFDSHVVKRWPRRHDLRVGIDSVEWTYIEPANAYRFKYHLDRPYAAEQRLLMSQDNGAAMPNQEKLRRQHLQESVYLDVAAPVLPVESEDPEEYIELQVMQMRSALADQALKGTYWLTNPQAYIVTYRPEELEELAQLQQQRGHVSET